MVKLYAQVHFSITMHSYDFLFFCTDDNTRYLLKVQEAKTEAEIQAILSHHLFSKLVSSGSYILNADCNPLGVNKCPVCGVELVLGNTSLGITYVKNIVKTLPNA